MGKYKNNIIATLPNILSISRIILSPILFLSKNNRYVLFFILIIIGLTDVLDGYLARKYKKQTIIGSWLDSISDLIFYILLVIYTLLNEYEIINAIKYYVIIVIVLKLLTIIIGFIKYKKFGFLHTLGNKITGIILFVGLCFYILFKDILIIKIGLFFSIISSLEELLITMIKNKYNENIKGIWEYKN